MEKFVGNSEYGIEEVVAQGIVDIFDKSMVDSHDVGCCCHYENDS